MITVIADDITGAAEIAGTALRYGLRVGFTTSLTAKPSDCDVFVIATDTRSGSADQAEETMRIICNGGISGQVFKKTDSVLRGHIVRELTTLCSCLNKSRALLIAQNPSKERVIENGHYFIGGTPLSKTSFSYDPEFPATTSDVTGILGKGSASLPLHKELSEVEETVLSADATSLTEIMTQLSKADSSTIIAGGADCFSMLLVSQFHSICMATPIPLPQCNALIVCGSTQSRDLSSEPYIKKVGASTYSMPLKLFLGEEPVEQWTNELSRAYSSDGSIILTIGHPAQGGKDFAVRLRNTMASATASLIQEKTPELLVIEGGATAYAILQELHWDTLSVVSEIAPGVVRLRYKYNSGNGSESCDIILKPGSYPWGKLFD